MTLEWQSQYATMCAEQARAVAEAEEADSELRSKIISAQWPSSGVLRPDDFEPWQAAAARVSDLSDKLAAMLRALRLNQTAARPVSHTARRA